MSKQHPAIKGVTFEHLQTGPNTEIRRLTTALRLIRDVALTLEVAKDIAVKALA